MQKSLHQINDIELELWAALQDVAIQEPGQKGGCFRLGDLPDCVIQCFKKDLHDVTVGGECEDSDLEVLH